MGNSTRDQSQPGCATACEGTQPAANIKPAGLWELLLPQLFLPEPSTTLSHAPRQGTRLVTAACMGHAWRNPYHRARYDLLTEPHQKKTSKGVHRLKAVLLKWRTRWKQPPTNLIEEALSQHRHSLVIQVCCLDFTKPAVRHIIVHANFCVVSACSILTVTTDDW